MKIHRRHRERKIRAMGPVFWYQAGQGVYQNTQGTIPASAGDRIARWDDQSGNGHHLTWPDPRTRPTLTSAGIQFLSQG